MCVYLLLSFLKFESGLHKSLKQILRIWPLNLFEKRGLMALLRGGSKRSSSSELTSDVIGLKVNGTAVASTGTFDVLSSSLAEDIQ